ncbi:hypothetical protein GPX89_13850 [Nocardia sp. ET3-3]|uniref:Nitroreductase family deazaflavin-dependent oxidoreductase n=1 Tax=Nocardia terrae TaxID=2675851 RepID=A0A7K1UVD5_9NOCA|nr:hypothetical protein [Nocardia terrae]MVU78324.1 hypothetical protein [Nocardia terrae]
MSTGYETPGFGASAVLMALRLPTGLGRTVGELRYTARNSGRHIAFPVMFVKAGDRVIIRVGKSATKVWWRNFRSPHPASIRVGGHWLSGPARTVWPGTVEFEEAHALYERAHPRFPVFPEDPYVVIDAEPGSA